MHTYKGAMKKEIDKKLSLPSSWIYDTIWVSKVPIQPLPSNPKYNSIVYDIQYVNCNPLKNIRYDDFMQQNTIF